MTMTLDTLTAFVDAMKANPGHLASSTLTADMAAAATSFSVVEAHPTGEDDTPFHRRGEFVVLIGSELISVNRIENLFTLASGSQRGAFGSTAATHSAGDTVYQAVLYDVVGSQVWEADDDDTDYDAWENKSAAVIVQAGPETRHPDAPVVDVTFSVRCYSGTARPKDVRAVYRLLDDRVHALNVTMDSGGIMEAWTHNASTPPMEPGTGWLLHACKVDAKMTG